MNLARFHRGIDLLDSDVSHSNFDSQLDNLISILNQLASSATPELAVDFKNKLETLRTTLTDIETDFSRGEGSEILSRLNLLSYWGEGLFRRVMATIEQNQLSPALAASALQTLRADVNEKLSAIHTINERFSILKIGYTYVENGESEILLDLPVEAETRTLDDLSKESKEWHRIYETISETFDPDREPAKIATLASGSWLIYLATSAAALYGFAKCIKGVNEILAEAIKMKSLFAQLVEAKAPKKIQKDLEEHNASKAKTDLEKLAAQLVDEHYKGNDVGRKNELKNALSIALQKLARKLADGAKVDLRLTLPKKPKIAEGQAASVEQEAVIKQIAALEPVRLAIENVPSVADVAMHKDDLGKLLPAPIEPAQETGAAKG